MRLLTVMMNTNLKKLFCLLGILLLIGSLVSCGKKKEEDEDDIVLEPIPTVPTYTGKSLKDSPFVGSFSCSWSSLDHSSTDDDSWKGRVSTLVINEDGSFSLRFDSLADSSTVVMTSVTGTVTVKDDTAECVIKQRDLDDFLGSDVGSFSLTLIDSDEIRYFGEQMGMVANRDIFSRDS